MPRSFLGPLAAGLALLVFFACKSDDRTAEEVVRDEFLVTRAAVQEVIADVERRDRLLALIDAYELLVRNQSRDMRETSLALTELNAAPETGEDELLGTMERLIERRSERRREALDVHFEMVALVSADEWKAMAKSEAKAIRSMRSLESN